MPLEFDSSNEQCSAVIDGVTYTSRVNEVEITTNDVTHMSQARIDGVNVPITEAEADALTVGKARDFRHHTVDRGEDDQTTVI